MMENSPQILAQQISDVLARKGSASTVEFGEAAARLGEIENELIDARRARDALQEELDRLETLAVGDVGDMEPIVTEYTAELEELRAGIIQMTEQLRAQAEENDAVLEEILAIRAEQTEKLRKVFEALDAEQEKIGSQLDATQKELEQIQSKGPEMSEKKGRAQAELQKIKHDRCIFFGCIDVHPPELFEL